MIRSFKPALAIFAVLLSAFFVFACQPESSDQSTNQDGTVADIGGTVSPEIAVLAHRLVFAYMSDKTWGFFGATCEKWIEMDYQWETSMSEHQTDGRIKITYERKPERIIGPERLVFFVDVDRGEVEGDNLSETGRSGVAEGCDKW